MNYKYKRIINPRNNQPVYRYGPRIVKRESIPADILEVLDVEGSYDEVERTVKPPKVCMICKNFGKMTRMVNLKVVVLCEEHYYSMNMGKIVQHLREKEHVGER